MDPAHPIEVDAVELVGIDGSLEGGCELGPQGGGAARVGEVLASTPAT